jgi:formamidopyrimidine-DNA glycosylase
MPELPEVETTKRGISPACLNNKISDIIIRQHKLRWPIPSEIKQFLPGEKIQAIERRGKYLLLSTTPGTLIIHLGMSGCLRVLPDSPPAQKHDHVDIVFNDCCLRYTDPRRFGAMLWTFDDPLIHPLLKTLGPEPLSRQFNAAYLFNKTRKRNLPIKQLLMQNQIVVGIGNIYAQEALFMAGISPLKLASKITQEKYQALIQCIKKVLRQAIKAGGTTLKDFYGFDGKPGYFKQHLLVYGKENKPCPHCTRKLKKIIIGQRSTVYCKYCQH